MWSGKARGTVNASAFVAAALVGIAGLASGCSPIVLGATLVTLGSLVTLSLRSWHKLKGKCAELESARSAAVAAINDRDDRLAVVAHDLRTPLQAILMCTSALSEKTGSTESRSALRILTEAVDRMDHMIGMLLKVTRLEAGAFQIHCEPCAVATLMDHLTTQFELRFAARAMHLEFEYTDMMVMADRERILEVISNLLENALRHGPRDGRVRVVARPLEHEARFSVRDDGQGIVPADMSHLFERYWQARSGEGRGAGLGLYICRRLVEAHGGRIGAESTVGVGTEIWFTLPRADSAQRMDVMAMLHDRSAAEADHLPQLAAPDAGGGPPAR